MCTIIAQISPMEICRGGGYISEYKIRLKGGGDVGMVILLKVLHLSYTAVDTTL